MKRIWTILGVIVVLLVVAYFALTRLSFTLRTDINPLPPRVELELTDDRIEDKNPTFDATLVDSRPMGDWEINKSDAVIKLDCPIIRSDTDAALLVLRPSYRHAIVAAKSSGHDVLPSANLIDGAAKQFDDGLYAAIDLACYRGELGAGPSAPDLVRKLFDGLPQGSPARPFLAAALELAGKKTDLEEAEATLKEKFLSDFRSDKERSKTIGFYSWTPELEEVWRFYRFLQYEFAQDNLAIPKSIAEALRSAPDLLTEYRFLNRFYGSLTNPMISLPVDALIGEDAPLSELAERHGTRRWTVCVFPPSTSRETELFERLFGGGLPPNVDLMGELIRRIRSGEVDLAPDDEDGWYQYQVYALETMLLPGKGHEADKLQLMATYKKRLVEAFKALVTKRRETHVRQLADTEAGLAEYSPLEEVTPRLRVEPCATFYLRTARAYGFLQNFLVATCGEDTLGGMHGLRKDGTRQPNLFDELDAVRQRFYGFYLITCEDIGMRPEFLPDEPVDQGAAKELALAWLEGIGTDPDLACDTRVAVPIFRAVMRGKTRLWATLGVRLAKLDASYARPPRVRPKDSDSPWEVVVAYKLVDSNYVIPVDEFGEFEIDGSNTLTRDELRAICDQHKTREDILAALSRQ